ncbi:hypothetical protein [Mycobacterium uberis]|nr:hypothetical protein [Mycobacterium uberis]
MAIVLVPLLLATSFGVRRLIRAVYTWFAARADLILAIVGT